MTAFLETRVGRLAVWVMGAALLVLLGLAVGRLMPTQPLLGIGVALGVLGLGITAGEPAAIPLLSIPMLLVVARVGSGGLDLSVSDAVLFLATLAALVFAHRPYSPPLRNLLWLAAVYQFATLFTVIVNPYAANVIEWFHAWMLVAGASVVGWAIGRGGHAKLGLSLFLVTALVLALLTIAHGVLQFAQGNFSPVYLTWPYGMHKNFVGTVLGFSAITAYVRPAWMGWSRRAALAAFWVMSVGLLFTQSRQAILALGVVLVVVVLRGGGESIERGRSKAILLAVLPAMVLVGTLVKDQVLEGSQFNSVFQRIAWFQETLAFWEDSPWVGHGLRYWSAGQGPGYQPPNAELEVLASAGVVGLVGFLILVVGAIIVLWRLDPVYGTLGVAVLLSRVVQSQLDLFWVAVQTSVPFVVAGICLGVEALAREERRLASLASATRPAPLGAAPVTT